MQTNSNPWVIVYEREGVGRLDTWSEYLCAVRTDDPEQCEIAICRHEVIGELPREWFDDDWQPLPEYSDAEGNLVLPDQYDVGGRSAKLTGHDGEYLLGELSWDEEFGGPYVVNLDDDAALTDAFDALGWKSFDLALLRRDIRLALSPSN